MSTDLMEGPAPSDIEIADDDRYRADFCTLVEVFKSRLQGQRDLIVAKKVLPVSPQHDFARELKWLSQAMVDGWGAPDAQYPQQCFDDWGPAILLRALATAYAQPAQVQE